MGAVQRQRFLHTSAGALSVMQVAGVDTVADDYSYILDLVAHLASLPSLVDVVDVYYMPLKGVKIIVQIVLRDFCFFHNLHNVVKLIFLYKDILGFFLLNKKFN